ncbi:MAG: hypothetical protein ACFFAU_02620 [Candidatus Hodarchaeota archaeon]
MQKVNLIAKLLDNPNAVQILKLLSEKPLSIPQIIESQPSIDSHNIIAILVELHRFKLIKLINKEISELFQENHLEMNLKDELGINVGTLGISLPVYVSIWEELDKNPNKVNFKELNGIYISLPKYIREKILDCDVNEIRDKILGGNSGDLF